MDRHRCPRIKGSAESLELDLRDVGGLRVPAGVVFAEFAVERCVVRERDRAALRVVVVGILNRRIQLRDRRGQRQRGRVRHRIVIVRGRIGDVVAVGVIAVGIVAVVVGRLLPLLPLLPVCLELN